MSYQKFPVDGKLNSQAIKLADPLVVFQAPAEARAHLVASGDFDFHEAVDGLWAAAVRANLVLEIGTDRIQEIMASAFAPIHSEFEKPSHSANIANICEESDAADPDDDYAGLTHSFARACRAADAAHAQRTRVATKPTFRVAESTLQAAEYLLRLGDRERLRARLAEHSPAEREAIRQHLKQNRAKPCPK